MWNFLSALRLGLPFVPSYLGQNGRVEGMIQGLNYASAGAGIIFTSGSELVCFKFSPWLIDNIAPESNRNVLILILNQKAFKPFKCC